MTGRGLVLALAGCSLALWTAVCAVWVALLWLEAQWGCPGLTDESGGADAQHWSWLPPGEVCEYQVDDGTHVDNPSDARLAVACLLVVWPTSTVALAAAATAPGLATGKADPSRSGSRATPPSA